jgi:hypothetical protein
MKKSYFALCSAVFVSTLISAGNVTGTTITDSYIGGVYYDGYGIFDPAYNDPVYGTLYDDPTGDINGTAGIYQVSSMDVTLGNSLQVDIRTNFTGAAATGSTSQFGDLFISNNGYNPTAVSSNFDYWGNGEQWEYALVLDDHSGTSGDLYLFEFDLSDYRSNLILSDDAFRNTNNSFRNGQEVQFNTDGRTPVQTDSSGNWIANGSWTQEDWGISFTLFDASLLNLGFEDLGLRWTMTCANDIIEGSAPVPEPATMLLFGAGLAGVAGLRLRKKKA